MLHQRYAVHCILYTIPSALIRPPCRRTAAGNHSCHRHHHHATMPANLRTSKVHIPDIPKLLGAASSGTSITIVTTHTWPQGPVHIHIMPKLSGTGRHWAAAGARSAQLTQPSHRHALVHTHMHMQTPAHTCTHLHTPAHTCTHIPNMPTALVAAAYAAPP
jgi:hypothetical protein